MATFLLAIPREEILDSSILDLHEIGTSRLTQVAAQYVSCCGRRAGSPCFVSPLGAGNRSSLLYWSDDPQNRDFASVDNRWCVTGLHPVAADLVRSMSPIAGSLGFNSPVWGTYSAILGDTTADRVVAWNTYPAIDAIHYTTFRGWTYVSNHPVLCAIARGVAGLGSIDLAEEFIDEYLAYGYSVSGQTAFRGVTTLPVRTALRAVEGHVSFVDAPYSADPLSYPDPAVAGERLAAAILGATKRALGVGTPGPIQLRMSGGKDSRIMAGALTRVGCAAEAVTYGGPGSADAYLAQRMCRELGIPLEVKAPDLNIGESVRDASLATLYASEGLPPSEAHVLPFAGACETRRGQPITLGQWPLYKGGMAKRLRYPPGGEWDVVQGQISLCVSTRIAKERAAWLRQWFDSQKVGSDFEKLYLFATDFRSGRWLHAHVAHYSFNAAIAYPLCDSEVTAVCDRMDMVQKVSERALYHALLGIWPSAAKLPLDRSVWRFESSGYEPPGTEGFREERARVGVEMAEDLKAQLAAARNRVPFERRAAVLVDLARQVREGQSWQSLRDRMSPAFDQAFVALSMMPADGGDLAGVVPAGLPRALFTRTVWRFYAAHLWMTREWLGQRPAR